MKFSLFHEELFFANFFIVSLKELFKESVNRQETSISPFSVFVILSLLSGKKFPPWNRHKWLINSFILTDSKLTGRYTIDVNHPRTFFNDDSDNCHCYGVVFFRSPFHPYFESTFKLRAARQCFEMGGLLQEK